MPSDINKISFLAGLHNFVRTKIQDGIQNQAKGIPGHVSKILENDFIEFTIDLTGPFTNPKLTLPQAFSKYHREPTKVGDKGVAVPTDYAIGGSSGDDGNTANLYPRGNLTPLTFHPISNKNWPKKDPDMFLVTAGDKGHTTQSADGTTSTVIDAANNLLHTSSGDLIGQATKQIAQIAQKTMTIASIGDVINHVAQKITMGAPATSSTRSSTDEPTIPIPSAQTLLNVIGSITASGSIGAAGGFSGSSGGGSPSPGSMGEVISAVVTTPVNLAATATVIIASIPLTPGDWDIQGNIFMTVGATATSACAAAIAPSASFPGTPALNSARSQTGATIPANNVWYAPVGPCRALITTQTPYYLIGYCATAATATGVIWARRI